MVAFIGEGLNEQNGRLDACGECWVRTSSGSSLRTCISDRSLPVIGFRNSKRRKSMRSNLDDDDIESYSEIIYS